MRTRQWQKRRARILITGLGFLGLLSAVGLLATEFEIRDYNGTHVDAKWPGVSPNITWNLNFTTTPAGVVENGGVTTQAALANAFNAWQNARYNGAAVTSIAFTFGSAGTAFPSEPTIDCNNVLGFSANSDDFSTGIIAMTIISTVTNGQTPSQCSANPPPACPNDVCIVDADVAFNPDYTFATATPGSGQFDLQSVATHETGHMIGLDHSGIAHAVMYPYGDTSSVGVHQALWTDDLAGISHLYPGATTPSGLIAGQVTMGGGGIYGAHVVAIDSTTGNAVTDTLTDPSGNYSLLTFGGTFYVYVQSLGSSLDWGPYTIQNFRGQAGYDPTGNNSLANIPANPTNYTGVFY